MSYGEVFVVTGSGQGHVHPSMELCHHLLSRGFLATLVAPSTLSSSIPSSFSSLAGVTVLRVSSSPGPPMPSSSDPARQQAIKDLSDHLSARIETVGSPRVLCAIVDFQLGWTKEVFWKFDVPVVGFFTFSACAAAMELGSWKAQVGDVGPGEARSIPGLPEEMSMTLSDLKRKPMGHRPLGPAVALPSGQGPKPGGGPPKPGDRPPWLSPIEGSVALMFNTCAELEAPFLEYMGVQMGIPAWGVGPLLPDRYWNRSDSLMSDREIRGEHQRDSNIGEDGVISWLGEKPRRSVLYVAFGSETGPTEEELSELGSALGESTWPFIWAVGSKMGSSEMVDKLEEKVGDRGLIIRGWAPQLLILSHPSTGGFLSHCGWNSTAEALGLGVPFLAWPIMGDQHHNTKLVVKYLKVGYKVAEDMSETVRKDQIVKGIESLMSDEKVHQRAAELKAVFGFEFPASSTRALDAFKEFVSSKE
ncbi:hypothetical protein MLD38_021005 [Melastoma candidum]|uniref:Uncharacterized protein n=1 Tax=Melastoma candidum TaxID=119954 RepID=A0ACB9QES5_9MYRT|nr:hypothetical protein MLD38_021005 [Melastoma candidum]